MNVTEANVSDGITLTGFVHFSSVCPEATHNFVLTLRGRTRIMSRSLWTLIAFAALLCVACASELETPQDEEDKECLADGGICVHLSNCPAEKMSAQAKCSKQEFGAVCCHSAHPPQETRCEMLQGVCRTSCGDNIRVAQAQDCPPDQSCCALV